MYVNSIVKSMAILELLADRGELRLVDIAVLIGADKSGVYRILSTLRGIGFVTKNDENGRYRLTIKMFSLGVRRRDIIIPYEIYRPILDRLAHKCGETVHLAMLRHNEIIYLDKIDSQHLLRMHSSVGGMMPAHSTGLGKILLAQLPWRDIEQIYPEEELPIFTQHTISSRSMLRKVLPAIKKNGYCYDQEESEAGISCIAVPVYDQSGSVICAISVTGATIRMPLKKLEACRDNVLTSSAEITAALRSVNSLRQLRTAGA